MTIYILLFLIIIIFLYLFLKKNKKINKKINKNSKLFINLQRFKNVPPIIKKDG